MSEKRTTPEDLEERVVYAVLGSMARLAGRFEIPLRRIKQLAELAYYQEMRRRGLRMKEIQDVMSIGFSKVGTLSQQFKAYHAGSSSSEGFGLQRRILLLLWAAPLTEKHLVAAFSDAEEGEVLETVARMVEEGRLEAVPGRTVRYKVSTNHNLLLQDGLLARLSALGSLMSNTTQVIESRFFGPSRPAFVRTLNFRARERDLEKLQAFYNEALIPLIRELDEAVTADEPSVPIKLSLLWVHDTDIDEDNTRVDNAGSAGSDGSET